MRVRRATLADAAALTAFGRRLFGQTFAPENSPGDLGAYLDETYVEARQLAELADPQVETLLVEDGEALIAFAQLREGAPGSGVTGGRSIELWRFYVDFDWHGRGVAPLLMRAVEDAARARDAVTLLAGSVGNATSAPRRSIGSRASRWWDRKSSRSAPTRSETS
jgi:GNAT superfamily N-acetyltransferase